MSDRDVWAVVFMATGFLVLGYNLGSMAKIASIGNQQVVAETQVRGER